MSIKYLCRCCHSTIGEIDQEDVTEYELGFHNLTPTERREIILFQDDGHIHVLVICDYCKEALEANPDLMLVANPLQ